MTDVGLGQLATTTGRARSKILREANVDSHPLLKIMDDNGGIRRIGGGRTIVEEAKSGQNSTVKWVGESGNVSVLDQKVVDASEHDWRYLLGLASWTMAEQLKNSGGDETQYVDLVASKYEVLEDSMMNTMHEGLLSNGSGEGGLQIVGLAALVPTNPLTGTIGTIDRSADAAAWYRSQKLAVATDSWGGGTSLDASNIKLFLDKGLNATMKNSKIQVQVGFLGQNHFEYLTQAIQAHQIIQNVNGEGKVGFDKLIYRGVPMYMANGVNYSGKTAATVNRSYLLNVKPGGVNLVYHKKAEYALLEPFKSQDQAAVSRLMFTMCAMVIGAYAKLNWVGYEA